MWIYSAAYRQGQRISEIIRTTKTYLPNYSSHIVRGYLVIGLNHVQVSQVNCKLGIWSIDPLDQIDLPVFQ